MKVEAVLVGNHLHSASVEHAHNPSVLYANHAPHTHNTSSHSLTITVEHARTIGAAAGDGARTVCSMCAITRYHMRASDRAQEQSCGSVYTHTLPD